MTAVAARLRVGLIADTHNLLRPEALAGLRGCDRIIHAGDICKPEILERLAELAPVSAVRGNNDKGAWADRLPVSQWLVWAGVTIYVIHDLKEIETGAEARADVVVSGHAHRPRLEEASGVLFVNPGSAGPRRFKLPVSLAVLDLQNGEARARLVHLDVPGSAARRG